MHHLCRMACLAAALIGMAQASAQSDIVYRYVNAEEGSFSGAGTSWATAKNNLQAAIDELYEEIRATAARVGYVYVAGLDPTAPSNPSGKGMVYVPSRRSTDDADGSLFSTSFRIPERIYVFGGFRGNETAADESTLPGLRLMANGLTMAQNDALTDNVDDSERPWKFKYVTVLSGNHSQVAASFTYDASRGRYATSFPLNSYHVVWFATNGTIGIDNDDYAAAIAAKTITREGVEKLRGHFRGLPAEACVDGCTIEEGNASSNISTSHEHTGYGGGVYMVKNALLRNCIVERCAATMRGGGVYMDGGGEMERCYVNTCQATGVGVVQGYGGAVCIDYDGAVKHSYIIQCGARIGAGVAICHVAGEYPEVSADRQDDVYEKATPYSPFCVATVIANCTSTAEGGGVYLDEGGTLNHCTIVRNTCVGPDVVYYGRRHGRTGGIYVRTAGTIYNSVAWGNTSPVNSDVQFASFREATAKPTDKIAIYHSAFSNHDITNWAYASKEQVLSLSTANVPQTGEVQTNFPCFSSPTASAGIQYDTSTLTVDPTANADGQPYQDVYNWHPMSVSSLCFKAVQVNQDIHGISDEVLHAHTTVDVVGCSFEAVSSSGALVSSQRALTHAMVESQEEGEDDMLPTLFVDPACAVLNATNDSVNGTVGYLDSEAVGNSWNLPVAGIPDAIRYFKQFQITDLSSPDYAKYDIDGTIYDAVQILVKEGTLTVAGTGSYLANMVRTASIRPVSNMRLYGGFASSFTGTDTDGRNQRATPTTITADVINGGYANNSAHVFSLVNCRNVIIDGFRINYGNANLSANESEQANLLRYGGGIIVSNSNAAQSERIDMVGNILRNSQIANCSSPEGAAIYVNGLYPKANGNVTHAELSVVNTIIRNNSTTSDEEENINVGGVVVANGNAVIHIDHCDVLNNRGCPLETLVVPGTVGDGESNEGRIDIHNSIIYANANAIADDRIVLTNATTRIPLIYKSTDPGTVTGSYVYTDAIKEENLAMHWPAGFDATCRHFLSYNSSDVATYPRFKNPSRNIGHNEDSDKPLYGGSIDYEPMNQNPVVNAAGDRASGGVAAMTSPDLDMACEPRTYGGCPDIGAIENQNLPRAGAVIYVTPDGAGRRDGSSWDNAIAGNTIYALNGAATNGTDELDTANGTTRIINTTGDGTATTGAADGVLTTDQRYCGGFASAWVKEYRTGVMTRTTITDNYITETNVYTGGLKNGVEEVVRNAELSHEESTEVLNAGTLDDSFEAWHDDSRYPYGELSGMSRSPWRAVGNESPVPEWWVGKSFKSTDSQTDPVTGETVTGIGGGTDAELIGASSITNDRTENYVGGLQYAVEMAAAYNRGDLPLPDRVDSVQVWVSNGKYTDYKGFIMRDNTTVMGSFPAVNTSDGSINTPGMMERQALMSAVESIPKAMKAANNNAVDYETIIQLSDTNPVADGHTFNEAAVNSWDNDYNVVRTTDTQTVSTQHVSITRQYRWGEEDVSARYLLYPDLIYTDGKSVFRQRHKTQDTPVVKQYFGKVGETNSWNLWYDDRTNNVNYNSGFAFSNSRRDVIDDDGNVIGSVSEGMDINGGSLLGVNVWQTMTDVPAGIYHIEADLAAFYRELNDGHDAGVTETGVTFNIEDAEGNTLVSQTIYCPNNTTPYKLKRYKFDVVQPSDGNLTLRILVAPGTQATDPVSGALPAYKNNPNRREVLMGKVSVKVPAYLLESSNEERTVDASATTVSTTEQYEVYKERKVLRKRVLQMPDVTNPACALGTYFGDVVSASNSAKDDISHSERVKDPNRKANNNPTHRYDDPNYQRYDNVIWDGFTIRHGFIYDISFVHGGGSGVSIYEGAHLRNCIITSNYSGGQRMKGGGVFCDGATATVEGCFILNNTSTHARTNNYRANQIFAGGFFLYEGVCFNTLIANNYARDFGGGLGLCVGKFYNNTIAYNTSGQDNGGLRIADGAASAILLANTIIYGNNGAAISMTSSAKFDSFKHCYIQSAIKLSDEKILNAIMSEAERASASGISNQFMNGEDPSADTTPFAADIGSDGGYTGGAQSADDFRLLTHDVGGCVNTGADADELDLTLPNSDVAFADRVQDCEIDIGAYEYDGTKDIEPDLTHPGKAIFYVSQNGGGGLATGNSPANAACMSKLQKILDAAGRWKYAANFYLNTDEARQLDSDYHYNWTNFSRDVLLDELTQQGVLSSEADAAAQAEALAELQKRTVMVKVAGDYTTPQTGFKYAPTRSAVIDPNADEENILEFSLIVPRGIQVYGGYDGTFSDDTRDVLGYQTRFSGEIYNEVTATMGRTFHVVTFTEDLFGIDEALYTVGVQQMRGQLSVFDTEDDRAVLDGIFIQDGYASGTVEANRIGAATVVTSYAHVRNCVVTDNEATLYGGGLYMLPGALVSGTIVKNNKAQQGGGIYVEEDLTHALPNVHLFTTTVSFNEATKTGGGIYYTSATPNLIANSTVIWHNTANDLANVAGNMEAETVGTDSEQGAYPFNYCGIENRRVQGVNNLMLPVVDGEGVRWDHKAMYEDGDFNGTIVYMPITLSSVLSRAGMTYEAYRTMCRTYTTLIDEDIARLARMEQAEEDVITLAYGATMRREQKNNAFIDMGARVLNKSFEVKVDDKHVLFRLFVARTEDLPTPQALEWLQENTYEGTPEENDLRDLYKQMGSSFANPFHRVGDALDYIRDVRSRKDAYGNYPYRNTRFEVFVSGGEFYPFRDAYGQQGSTRTSTFVIPEAVTIVGGVQIDASVSGHTYCQAGYGEVAAGETAVRIAADQYVILNGATTQEIRDARARFDYNGNNVLEPWEMRTLSKLMGNAVDANSEGTTNIYHIITCMSDEEQVGCLPEMYTDEARTQALELDEALLRTDADGRQIDLLTFIKEESEASRDARSIILDGLQVTGGHANDINPEHAELAYAPDGDLAVPYTMMSRKDGETDAEFDIRKGQQNATQLTYFRGGGILVEGNWDNQFLTQGTLPEVLGVAKRDIPLVVLNCEFQNNQAGNGGAIYSNGTLTVVGCHFTQNLSIGPQTEGDQLFISWTAGGAIATNYECNVLNSLFDNNEARRGNLSILSYEENPRNISGISNADERQGSGGVISASETSVVRMAGCDLVMNKALQFPAIYNFYDNELRNQNVPRYGAGRHFAVNTIFWGNDVPEDYHDLPMALANTAGTVGGRKRYHVANFGPDLDEEVLYFCAHEDGCALPPVTPALESQRQAQKKTSVTDLSQLLSGEFFAENFPVYNNNQIVSSDNTAADGPYFVLPSTIAGIDGYMQNADWLVSRLNATIDNGWSYLAQRVTQPDASSTYLSANFYTDGRDGLYDPGQALDAADWCSSPEDNPALDGRLRVDADSWLELVDGKASNQQSEGLDGSGFFLTYSRSMFNRFRPLGFNDILPVADETYMNYTRDNTSGEYNMRRISTHPRIGQQDVYIDIGIYEYQYVQLTSQGNEVDVIWVGPSGSGTRDGSSARNCSNDLQGAIETLLLSRNGHDKVIKLIGGAPGAPAEFSPLNTTSNNKLAFYIKVPEEDNGVTNPSRNADEALGIKSLTIRGGYSPATPDDDDGESLRSTETFPVVLRMAPPSGYTAEQLDHLLVIENVQQRETYGNFINARNTNLVNEAVPIILDGLIFENSYATEHDESEGGAALFYGWQYNHARVGAEEIIQGNLRPAIEVKRNAEGEFITTGVNRVREKATDENGDTILLPKLTVRNCIFRCNGADGNSVPAVQVREGGGESLFINTLFHSNNGIPLQAVGTKVVNCTFALNTRSLRMGDCTEQYARQENLPSSALFPSEVHNSILWRNNRDGSGDYGAGRQYDFIDVDAYNVVGAVEEDYDITDGKLTAGMFTYNAVSNHTADVHAPEDAHHNISLSANNGDVFYGPNFVDPFNEVKAERDFHVGVSQRILSSADTAVYLRLVPYHETYREVTIGNVIYPYNNLEEWRQSADEACRYSVTRYAFREVTDGEGNSVQTLDMTQPYSFHSVQRGCRSALNEAQLRKPEGVSQAYYEVELAGKPRLLGGGMERGAYESEATVQRVLYVSGEGGMLTKDGSGWATAFALEDLQDAVNVASIYYNMNAERAYVFVKGDDATAPAVIMRDGVSVYGSLRSRFYGEAIPDIDYDGEAFTGYSDDELARYVRQVQSDRDGIAARGATMSTIRGLAPDAFDVADDYSAGFLLDGFRIQADAEQAEPLVVLSKTGTAVAGSVITGNTVSGGEPVVDVQRGLLYNSLVYGNTADVVVSLGAAGYALNNTIVAANSGETPLDVSTFATAIEQKAHEQNNIAVNEGTARGMMFAPYLTASNVYTLPAYLSSHALYAFQLHEHSREINAGSDDGGSGVGSTLSDGGNSIAKAFAGVVDFGHDRDLLGNPRRMGGRVDNGAFEAWRVDGNVMATNVTNIAGAAAVDAEHPEDFVADNRAAGFYDSYSLNYGGHSYPHPGSVVYVMADANLLFATNDTGGDVCTSASAVPVADGGALFTDANPIRPGYVYVAHGGSVYGQGNVLRLPYVAADREYAAGVRHDLVAMPFDNLPSSLMTTTYTDATDALAQTSWRTGMTAYAYDGAGRALWNYGYHADQSPLWLTDMGDIEIDGSAVAGAGEGNLVQRTQGWFMELDEPTAEAVALRFTGWGPADGTYAYTEAAEEVKTVTLTQHDSHPADGSAHFTSAENMGWNLKGSPWLVAQFTTGGTNPDFGMNVPHVLYRTMSRTLSELATADELAYGQFYTDRSWSDGVALTLGDGFFTQTAVMADSEELSFCRPQYAGATEAPVRAAEQLDIDLWTGDATAADTSAPAARWADRLTLVAADDADPAMPYRVNADGIKWQPLGSGAPSLWVENADGTPFALAAHAPTATLLPVGINIPANAATASFAMPAKGMGAQASAVDAVWLVDYGQQQAVNLLEQGYAFDVTDDLGQRFAIQLGGTPPFADSRRTNSYRVYVRNHVLHVEGTRAGDRLRLYTPDGATLTAERAQGTHWQKPLHKDGIYIVRIEGETHKVSSLGR